MAFIEKEQQRLTRENFNRRPVSELVDDYARVHRE